MGKRACPKDVSLCSIWIGVISGIFLWDAFKATPNGHEPHGGVLVFWSTLFNTGLALVCLCLLCLLPNNVFLADLLHVPAQALWTVPNCALRHAFFA